MKKDNHIGFRYSNDFKSLNRINKMLVLGFFFTLLSILGNQIYHRTEHGLSRWKGSGMGMFADHQWVYRSVLVEALVNGNWVPVVVEGQNQFIRLRNIFKIYPSEKNQGKLIRSISQLNFQYLEVCTLELKSTIPRPCLLNAGEKTRAQVGAPITVAESSLRLSLLLPHYDSSTKLFQLIPGD